MHYTEGKPILDELKDIHFYKRYGACFYCSLGFPCVRAVPPDVILANELTAAIII